MASVEDIYQKIRRGDTTHLRFSTSTAGELEAGVARIRTKLEKHPPPTQSDRRWRLYASLAAAAAVIVITFFVAYRLYNAPPTKLVAQGMVLGDSARLYARVLSSSDVQFVRENGAVIIRLNTGRLLIERTDRSLPANVVTQRAVYRLIGTKFIIDANAERETVVMQEGTLEFTYRGKTERISAGKNGLLTITNNRYSLPVNPSAKPRAGAQTNECVVYFRNNQKRRGKLHGKDAQGYIIYGDSGPEPQRYRDGDFFREPCYE